MMFVYSSLSFFVAPIAIVAMPVFLITMAVFGSDLIMNLVDQDPVIFNPDTPVWKVFPRFDSQNPDDIAWVSECYTKILDAYHQREEGGGLFTGNYMYPELRLNKIFDRYAITKNYFGSVNDEVLTGLTRCDMGDLSFIEAREVLSDNGVLIGDVKNSYKFTVNSAETYYINMNDPLTPDEVAIVNWYNSWCDDPQLQYLKQIYVSPLQPDIFKVTSFNVCQHYMAGSISVPIPVNTLDMFVNSRSRSLFYYSRYGHDFTALISPAMPSLQVINTAINSGGILPSYDNLGVMYWINDMAKAHHFPIEEMVTVFSSTAIHNVDGSNEFLAAFSNFQNSGWRNAILLEEQVENWPWPNIGYIEDLCDNVFANHDDLSSLNEIRRHLDSGYDLYDPAEPKKPSNLPFYIMVALMIVTAAVY